MCYAKVVKNVIRDVKYDRIFHLSKDFVSSRLINNIDN